MGNFLTEKDVAKQISVSLASLRRWRLLNSGPRFVKVGATGEVPPGGSAALDGFPAGRWGDHGKDR